MVARRSLRGETFDDHAGTQPAEDFDEQVDVLLRLPEAETLRCGVVLGGHRRRAENLQLVELHGRERQGVDPLHLVEQHRVGLAGKSEDEVCADVQAPRGGHLDGAAGAREVVAPVDGPERGVEGRFDAVFEGDIPIPGQPGEIVELALVDAVGARADDDSRHAGMREGLIVKPLQPLQRGVGVGKSLEIDQVALRRTVAVAVEFDPLGDLLPDALRGHAIRRGERSVVTERTPSLSDRPVAVGAGEARIDGKFLHPAAEQTAEVPRIGVEPPRIAPRVSHRYKPQSEGL